MGSLFYISEDRLARDTLRSLPLEVLQVIGAPSWRGGPLVALHNTIGRPSASILGKNFAWLLPFVKDSPSKARVGRLSSFFQSKHVGTPIHNATKIFCVHVMSQISRVSHMSFLWTTLPMQHQEKSTIEVPSKQSTVGPSLYNVSKSYCLFCQNME